MTIARAIGLLLYGAMGRNFFSFSVSCWPTLMFPSFLLVEWKLLLDFLLCCIKVFPCVWISHLKLCVKFD